MRSTRSTAALISILSLYCSVSTAHKSTSSSVVEPKTECLSTNDEHTDFVCLTAAESLRIPCQDADEQCPDWAHRGECTANPKYMLVHCRKACSSCISLHPAESPQMAPDQATRQKVLQRLYETQEYLHHQADRNIEALKLCMNKHSECTYWWAQGECSNNPRFMDKECSAACQTCHEIAP